MEIEILPPYTGLYSKAELSINHENRRVVTFSGNNGIHYTTYAKYLMTVKLGHFIPDGYEVDHIDNDKTNDDINNLQILTAEDNKIKQQWLYVSEQQNIYPAECAWCGVKFLLTERELNMRLAQNVEYVYCSKPCATNYNLHVLKTISNNLKPRISDEQILEIKRLRQLGLSSYKISDQIDVSRNTVMKYW